jgi:hypothetical protein
MDVGLRYHAAMIAVGAVTILGPLPELRPVISEARAILESVRARTWLERLDEAVAVQPVAPADVRSQVTVE